MFIFFLFLSLWAGASPDSKLTFDKSYPRDNTFCHFKNKRVELLIRGSQKFTEPNERGYGEFIFLRNLPVRIPMLMKLNTSRADTFKLFLGTSPQCSKSHGYMIGNDLIAVLLQKENRPFKDKLVIQLFDANSMTPKESIETNFPTDRATFMPDGFAFRVLAENHNPEMGRVMIAGEKFIYQEKTFPEWISYSLKGFEIKDNLTFDKFPWRNAFKDQRDFNEVTGWNEKDKKFTKKIVYLAVNHKLKKECLLFIAAKQKIHGSEAWRCQAR
jgi:hypothetical protein